MKKLITAVAFAIIAITIHAQSGYKILNNFKIDGAGGWDYIAVQPNSNNLYVSHGSQINILNKNTGAAIGVIPNTNGIHGMAFALEVNKGFTTNGKTNDSYVFDLKTFAVIDTIKTGQKPDAIYYDEAIKKIVVCNGKSNDLSFIDPITNKVVATVAVDGTPETAVGDGKGKVFVNLEDKSEIVAIDTKAFKVLAHWSIAPGEAPTGLVIDTKTNRLFAACSDNKLLIVVNATTGKVIDKLAIGGGCDGASFDQSTKNIFTSNGADGTITVVHEDGADKYSVIENIVTKKGARTITIDEITHKLYTPTADLEPNNGEGRPKAIPGTFQVLVVGK